MMIELKRSGRKLSRDLVFAAVADEEAGGAKGAAYLVENHPDLVRADFALCEFGGFRMKVGKRTFIPIQVAQKGCAWCRAIFEGEPGHGSVPRRDTAIFRMARALERLEKRGLPLQVCDSARDFISCIAAGQPPHLRAALRGLVNPMTHGILTARLPEHQAVFFNAILHPTAAPTVIRAGDKENVQPSQADVMLDGRVLPGQSWEQFEKQLGKVLGKHARLELLKWIEPVAFPVDTPLYDSICRVIASAGGDAEPVPYMVPGFTDAAHLARLGTVTYGFTPMQNDPQEPFTSLVHGHDERISIEAFQNGARMLYRLVEDFCTTVRSAPVLDDLLEPVAGGSAEDETVPDSKGDPSGGEGVL
ncbi:MAG: M20/M25/M40 family metallo-hydrolase [Deltaproteobacteria bacterium]|nr:MAG: M20/M25/M40 family metallo-hydrolase [Deltaproteobacteria bacterium]